MDEKNEAGQVDSKGAFIKIAGYLRDYPFLLIALAGLVLLGTSFAFDLAKLKEFKWLFIGIVLIPVFMQFYVEIKRQSHNHRMNEKEQQSNSFSPVNNQAVSTAGYSIKAIVSMVLIVLCFSVYADSSDEELLDVDLQYGLILFAGIALYLSAMAWREYKKGIVVGKKLIITDLISSSVLLFASFGWLLESNGL